MTVLPPEAGYRLWAPAYDSEPNPLVALEERVLRQSLLFGPGMRVLDLATGTGRWLAHVRSHGAQAFGVDLSAEMLEQASRKPHARGRLIRATLSALPVRDDFADVAICSFALGYIPSPETAFREMARTSRRIIVSDLHPEAVGAGWRRTLRKGGTKYEIANWSHSSKLLDKCAGEAGLSLCWRREERFGAAEFEIFEQAAKRETFDAACRIPAILISCWARA